MHVIKSQILLMRQSLSSQHQNQWFRKKKEGQEEGHPIKEMDTYLT
jgi:hypothetical protein